MRFLKLPNGKKHPCPFSLEEGGGGSILPHLEGLSLVFPSRPVAVSSRGHPAPPGFMGRVSGNGEGSAVRPHSSRLGFLETSAAKSSN